MTVSLDQIRPRQVAHALPGIELIELTGPGPLVGTVCRIDLRAYEFRVLCFRDLVDKPQRIHRGEINPSVSQNLGCSVRDFVRDVVRAHRGAGREPSIVPVQAPTIQDDLARVVIASNTLQTNFIRSNGFVVNNGRVIAKPLTAPGRLDPEYGRLGIGGDYTCLIVEGQSARVIRISIEDAAGVVTTPALRPGSYGIASPRLVESTTRGARVVPIRQCEEPFRDQSTGRLDGDVVEWDPGATATSFTAFGIALNEQLEESILVMASMFAGEWGIDTDANSGVLADVMGQIMIRDGRVNDAILGGGAADTQQFIRGHDPEVRSAPVRIKSPSRPDGEVPGIRGLGAIAAIFPRSLTRPPAVPRECQI